MRTTQLLTTVAAAVLLSASAAAAQDINGPVKPERAPAAQRHAPAGKIAPPMHAGERGKAETTGQGSADQGATHKPQPGADGNTELNQHGTVGAAPQKEGGDKSGTTLKQHSDTKGGARVQDNKSGDRDQNTIKSESGTNTKTQSSESSGSRSSTTTGQGAAAGAAKLTTQQRTKITTIIKKQKAEPAHLDIDVRVGVHVPSHVHYYPLPTQVVDVYPEWRGYDYILVSDQILVIDPDTRVVVAILET